MPTVQISLSALSKLILFTSFTLVITQLVAHPEDLFPENHHNDTTSSERLTFKQWSKSGEFEFHWRSFFMSTFNQGDLLDYSALASGAGLGYTSPKFKGFNVVFSGFFVFQLHQKNIALADPTTNGVNRYEVTLFDMHDLSNTRDLDRLEELFVQYDYKKWRITLGRQKFNSPLLNMQDNRMRPNIFSGLHINYRWKNLELLAAGFHAMTIRGTVNWYSVEESFGVYPFGRSPFGTSSEFKGNVRTKGIGVLGLKHNTHKLKSEVWNYTAENVFNLAIAQSEYKDSLLGFSWTFGAQGFYQNALNHGGNPDPVKAYILPNESTYAFGTKLAAEMGRHTVSFNTMHIANQGRFLFPREWGREIFYASLPRERFEGNGGLNAWTLKYKLMLPKHDWQMNLGASAVQIPDVNNVVLNKYGLPSYYHFILDIRHGLSGYFDGLHLRFLAVHKMAQNPSIPDNFRLNRVDLWQFNFIVDYLF